MTASPATAAPLPRGRVRAVARGASRDLAYLSLGLLTSLLAAAAWIGGVAVTVSLAVFVVGIPAFLASAFAFRIVADLDRRNAARILGRPVLAAYRDHARRSIWARVAAVAGDPQTWRDLGWLILHSVLGLAFGCLALTCVITTISLVVAPAWYWALPEGMDFGIWRVDTVAESFATVPLAIPAAAVTLGLLRVTSRAEAHLAAALLGSAHGTVPAPFARRPEARHVRPALGMHILLAGIAGIVCTLLWAVTGAGYYWPVWVWLGYACTLGLHVFAAAAIRASGDAEAGFRVRAAFCGGVALLCVIIWALAGGGYLWPVWPMIGMGACLAVYAAFLFRHRLPWIRERELVERVDELARTRRGALDVQAAELRRIERDLHDGAQARLVSLSMLMGRAEEHLADRPEVAELVRRAREEAGEAIRELRDLARGIAPPVLTDRGLAAAVEALAVRTPVDVKVDVDVDERPPPVVETAAYFVVAEALTNAAKHARGAHVRVAVGRRAGTLVVAVTDDGPGGANPAGSGLTGLRHRVEALDGTLDVASRAGAGTTIRAELPCGS
jgi:signal transduction histidine kinase